MPFSYTGTDGRNVWPRTATCWIGEMDGGVALDGDDIEVDIGPS